MRLKVGILNHEWYHIIIDNHNGNQKIDKENYFYFTRITSSARDEFLQKYFYNLNEKIIKIYTKFCVDKSNHIYLYG